MIKKIGVFITVLLLVTAAFSQTVAPFGGGRLRPAVRPIAAQLSEEQLAELTALIDEMRSNGATREDIQTAVAALLDSWGIPRPEERNRRFFRGPRLRPDSVLLNLTEEQKSELQELVSGLRENKAGIDEINEAVIALLTGWGIELPEDWRFTPRMRGWRRIPPESRVQLTEEQRQIIRDTIIEMREAGASREEIRAAVQALLAEFGITPPDNDGDSDVPALEKQETISLRNHPNPFNPDTHIYFTLTSPNHVKLSIYNLQGQLVRNLVNEHKEPGNYSVYWDALDQNGRRVVSGIYIYQITAGDKAVSNQMILMK